MSTPRSRTWHGHEVFEETWRGHGHGHRKICEPWRGHGHGHRKSVKRGVDMDTDTENLEKLPFPKVTVFEVKVTVGGRKLPFLVESYRLLTKS